MVSEKVGTGLTVEVNVGAARTVIGEVTVYVQGYGVPGGRTSRESPESI